MTTPVSVHQDPTPQQDHNRVSIMEYVTTVMASLDRRFDNLHQDLKDDVAHRFDAVYGKLADADLRYQQRFDQQQKALDAALAAAKEAVATALTAAEKATTKAEVAAERRFESVNEFRGQLADQAATLMPRSEAETRFQAMAEKLDDLKTFQASMMGQASASPVAAQIQALATRVESLGTFRDASQGKAEGLSQGWAALISAVALVSTLVAIFLALA